MTYLVKGKDAALSVGQTFSSNTPQAPIAALMLAATMDRHGKRADAIALLQATQAKTQSSPVTMLLSKYYVADKTPQKAMALLEGWTKSHPDDADARFGLAQLYGTANNFPAALQQFEWLATKRPNDSIILNNLAWLYSQKKDPRAQAIAERAYRAAPGSGSVADTLGWIMVGKGDTAGGLKYLQQASQASPADATIQYHFAVALTKSNRSADARIILEKLVNSDASADVKQSAKTLLAQMKG